MGKVTLWGSLNEKMNEHLAKGLINLAIFILYRLDTEPVSPGTKIGLFLLCHSAVPPSLQGLPGPHFLMLHN